MNTVQTMPVEEQTIRLKWGQFGVAIQKKELEFQARAQAIIAKLKNPATMADVPAAEEALKLVAAEAKQLQKDRIDITNRFNGPIARLSAPEKTLADPIAAATDAIIKIKKADADLKAKQKLKDDELKRIAELVVNYVAEQHAALLLKQSELIATAYNHALDNIPPENLGVYIQKVRKRVTLEAYTIPAPAFEVVHNSAETVQAAIADAFKPISGTEYVESFNRDLDARFDDYTLAWQNKAQARLIASQEAATNTAAIQQQKVGTIAAARIQALATPVDTAAPVTKALKSVWKLDMEEGRANAVIILSAFVANIDKCLPKIEGRMKNWFNLSIKQMISSLEALRNADEEFNTTGLQWKEEDKL